MGTPSDDLLDAIRRGLLVAGMLRRADLHGADLTGVRLAHHDLSGANLRGADLTGADLRGARLFATDLTGARLRDARLDRIEASGARFQDADLTGADLRMADLTGADLRGARCVRAQLGGADLSGADCYGALWTQADLRDAEIEDALQLTLRVPDPDRVAEVDPETAKDLLGRRVFGLHESAWGIIAAGDLDAALPLIEECCRLVPDYQLFHVSRASLLVRLDRIDEAEAAYRRALELVPNLASARLDLGRLLAGRGRSAEAVEHLEVAAAQPGTERVARRLAAELYASALNQPERAIAHLRELLQAARTPDILEELGRLLAENNRHQEAIELFEEVLQHRPEDAVLLRDVGVLYAEIGDTEEAVATLKDALSLDPNVPNVRHHLLALDALDDEDADDEPAPPEVSLAELLAQFAPESFLRSAVDLSQWAENELTEALRAPFPEHAPFTLEHLGGPSQDGVLARLGSPRGSFVAKGYLTQIVTRDELEHRIAFAEHLAEEGVPVPRPVRTAEDERCFAAESGHWMLMPWIEGNRLPRTAIVRKLSRCRALGAALAALHLASATFDTPGPDFQPRLGTHVTVASSYTAAVTLEWQLGRNSEALTAFQRRPGRRLLTSRIVKHAQVIGAVIDDLPRGMLHGDPAPRNLLWNTDGSLCAILDLDLASPGPFIFDLAIALESIASNMDDLSRTRRIVVDEPAADALIAGYTAIRPLTAKERQALPSMRRLAFVDRLVDTAVLVATEGLPLIGFVLDILESIVMARRNA